MLTNFYPTNVTHNGGLSETLNTLLKNIKSYMSEKVPDVNDLTHPTEMQRAKMNRIISGKVNATPKTIWHIADAPKVRVYSLLKP